MKMLLFTFAVGEDNSHAHFLVFIDNLEILCKHVRAIYCNILRLWNGNFQMKNVMIFLVLLKTLT